MLYQLVTYNHKVPRTFEEIEDIIQNGTVEDIENNWDVVDTYRNEADAYSAAEEFDPTVDEIIDQLESILQGTVITEIDHVMMCRMFFISLEVESEKERDMMSGRYEVMIQFDEDDRIKATRIILDRSMTFERLAEIVESSRLLVNHIESKFESAE